MENKTIIIIVALAVVFISAIYIFYKPSGTTEDVLKEINSLSPDETTIDAVKKAECKKLVKYDSYWIIDECKDDVYFKLFLVEDGYSLGYCSSWQTPREAFLKFRDLLPINECVNVTAEDRLFREVESYKMYEVCGLRVIFQDNCIIGVGRL